MEFCRKTILLLIFSSFMSVGWGEIIINEFFILQADSSHAPQYVELYNNSNSTIILENWSIITLTP